MKNINPNKRCIGIIALAFITLLTYASFQQREYLWDDELYTSPRAHSSFEDLKQLWLNPAARGHIDFPLTHTTFWVEYQLWKLNPLASYWINVFLHIINAILVWVILVRFRVPNAWICAAIFAVHPVCVESVAWISQRKNLLGAMFYLLSVHTFFRYYPTNSEKDGVRSTGRKGLYLLSLLFFVCSVLSKTTFCILPLVVLLLMWWKRGKIIKHDLLVAAPFFVVTLVSALFTITLEKNMIEVQNLGLNFTFLERFLIAGRALWSYVIKFLWPSDLLAIYYRWDVVPTDVRQYLFPLTFLGLLCSLWFWRARLGRACLVGLLFFTINLLPLLGFFNYDFMLHSFYADRYQYLACIGILTVMVAFLDSLFTRHARKTVKQGFCIGIILVLLLLSSAQIRLYKNNILLFEHVVSKNSTSWKAHNILGIGYDQKSLFRFALEHYGKSIEINPNGADAFSNRAITYSKLRRFDLAMRDFDQAIKHNPKMPVIYVNRAFMYFDSGQFEKSWEDVLKAQALGSHFSEDFIKALLKNRN